MDFAPINTDRMLFKYVSAGVEHGMQFRAGRAGTVTENAAAMRAAAGNLALALTPRLPVDFHFTQALYGVHDDPTMFPGFTLPTPVTGVVALTNYTKVMKATETTFKGTGGGSKVSVSVFGVYWDPSDVAGPADNGQVDSGEDADVALAITTLQAAAGLVSINNTAITWYPFATVKVNDYWLRRARKGGF